VNISIPTNRPIFESEIAVYWFDEEILISLSKPPKRTVENIRRNAALIKKITNNNPVPLLIYLSKSPVPDKQARKFATEQLPVIYSAMAMISKPGLAKFIMKLLFSFKPPPIPMKIFSHYEEAKQWLKHFL
jgi:hypothetical protein